MRIFAMYIYIYLNILEYPSSQDGSEKWRLQKLRIEMVMSGISLCFYSIDLIYAKIHIFAAILSMQPAVMHRTMQEQLQGQVPSLQSMMHRT